MGRAPGFSLSPQALIARSAESSRGIASIALELAEAQGVRLSKPDLDAELGRYAAEHPQLEGETRRVLIVAEHLYRLTIAYRRMRGRLRERERQALQDS
jgi:hypothetical protein